MMTDDSYPHTFKKRVQIQKRGVEFRIEGAPACSPMFFSGRGTRVLRRGYVPSCCNVWSYQGVDEGAGPGRRGTRVLISGSFRPLIVLKSI